MHEVKVRGATRSIYDAGLVYKGDFSDTQRLLLRLDCDQVQAFTIVRGSSSSAESSSAAAKEMDLSAGMLAGVACVALSLVLALMALAMWR